MTNTGHNNILSVISCTCILHVCNFKKHIENVLSDIAIYMQLRMLVITPYYCVIHTHIYMYTCAGIPAVGERAERAGRVGMGMEDVRFKSSREGLALPPW